MSTFTYNPAPPTWRLCHPVNIYVYRNGMANDKPCLVHIPMEKKKNMCTVLEAIATRMKLPVGYPIALYHMDGQRVCKTYELEMYNNYVMVTNLEKRFKCVDYGKVREPLVVNGPDSKHVNALKVENKKFDLFCRQKMHRKPLHELMASSANQDGLGPSELPVKPCGALCHKVMPRRDRPTQCCSDEIMCVEGAAMDVEKDECRDMQRETLNRKCWDEKRRSLNAPPGTQITDDECRLMEELQSQVKEGVVGGTPSAGPLGVNANLVDLMTRYNNVGSDIFKLFQQKINKDLDTGDSKVSSRWMIPGGSNLSLDTQQKVKEELIRLAEQSCQFTFDQYGNFIYSEECRVPGVDANSTTVSNMTVGTDMDTSVQGQQRTPSKPLNQIGSGGVGNSKMIEENLTVNMLEVGEVDEENNISEGSIPGLAKKRDSSKQRTTLEEATFTSQISMEDVEAEMQEIAQMAAEAEQEQQAMLDGKESVKRVSKLESVITDIVSNMRRSLVMSRSNSLNKGALPPGMISLPSSPKTALSAVPEEEEEEDGEEEAARVVISNGSNKNSKKGGSDEGDYGGANGGAEMSVFKLLMESRNPFKEGKVFPVVNKEKKNDKMKKSLAENPIRGYWFHGDGTPRAQVEEEEFSCLLPPPPPAVPSVDISPIFSPRGSKTEWWPPKEPDVFLQQINELVQRHDNTKSTSPPPPLPPSESSDSTCTFTIGPSPKASQIKESSILSIRSGQSKVETMSKQKKRSPRYRNVCAQVEPLPTEDEEELEPSPRESPSCYGSDMRVAEVQTVELPSEDEKPAGIYEGYQESLKSETMAAGSVSSENDGDDERKIHYRKRRANKRMRRKRKEKYLHPGNNYSPDEEDDDDVPNQPVQQVRFIVNNDTGGNGWHVSPSSTFPSQQQPCFVQTSSTSPTTFPLVARHSTQISPTTVMKTVQGGMPILLPQQYGHGRGGFVLQAQLPAVSNNSLSAPSSQVIRQPIVLTTTQNQAKLLPVLQPQNPSMRLIRIVHPSQQVLGTNSATTSGGALQNKLVQMMTPGFQPLLLPSLPQQVIQRPQHHQHFILKQ